MKKIILLFVIGLYITPSNLKAQNEGTVAALGGLLAIGSGIASVEQLKEKLEHKAVEEILSNHNMSYFKIKTSTLDGVSGKDVSSVSVVTYEVYNYDLNKRYILFSFLSSGWSNSNGMDFSKVKWKLFDATEWNNLIKSYIKTASKKDLPIEDINKCKVTWKGVLLDNKYVVNFKKIDGDTYLTSDYSDEFKIVFNEGRLGIYLKNMEGNDAEYSKLRGSLVQIRKKAIIRAHSYINFQ